MLISREKKLLFIHIQKTAGTSFATELRKKLPDVEEVLGTHSPALKGIEFMGDEWDSFYKIAFVRNPWDRLVSFYSMIIQHGKRLPWYRLLLAKALKRPYNLKWQYVLTHSRSFEEFIRNCAHATSKSGWKAFLFNQVDYLTDAQGEIRVDYIGRFETLSADVKKISQHLDLNLELLPRLNASDHKDYREYYNEETRDIVEKRFHKDVERFKYSF